MPAWSWKPWCGSCRRAAAGDLERQERLFAREDPRGFFRRFAEGAVLDEVQNVPDLYSWIQVIVDEKGNNGLFVLTGSRQLEVLEAVSQSLAGRTATVRLLPFSLEELSSPIDLDQLIMKGFYPRIWDQKLDPVQALSDYITTYVERDLRKISQVHDLPTFERFLGLCAGRVGQLLNLSSLANDTGVSHVTVSHWIAILEASYVLYRLKPYYANVGKRLVKSPKLYFYDVGLAARLLGIERAGHVARHPLRGSLFENLVVMEILKYRYNRALPENLYFLRDSKGNEIDILMLLGGSPYPVEVKSGMTLNREFFKGFTYFDSVFSRSPHRGAGMLVYGGDRVETRSGVCVTDLGSLARTFNGLER